MECDTTEIESDAAGNESARVDSGCVSCDSVTGKVVENRSLFAKANVLYTLGQVIF